MKKTTCGWMLTALLALPGLVLAVEPGKLVHGPLDTPYGQTLAFYQQDNNVTAYFATPAMKDGSDTPSEYALINDHHYKLGNVSIVAVFYQDVDKGGEDEVIVMYRDAAGKPHLSAWGSNGDEVVPLTRFTPQLEKVAASLDKFTVAAARKAIGALRPQQYLIAGFPQDLPDPVFNEVLASPDKYPADFLRDFDEIGSKAANANDINGYSMLFPDKFIERVNDKGENIKYSLTLDVSRQGSCGMDNAGFAPSGLYYQHTTTEKALIKEGPFVQFVLQNCQLIKNSAGQYHNNQLEGEWVHYSADNGQLLEKGVYRQGLREGVWQEYGLEGEHKEGHYHQGARVGLWQTFSPGGDIIAVENYQQDVLNGFWQRKGHAKGNTSAWVVEQEGQYLDGNKSGDWKEEMTTQPRYAQYRNGLLDGELRVTTLDGKNVTTKSYQHGLLNGVSQEWFANGQLKRNANYSQGQQQGAEYFYWDTGRLSSMLNWKVKTAAKSDLCKGMVSQLVCDRSASKLPDSIEDGEWRSYHQSGALASLAHWRDGKKYGQEYKFNDAGKLISSMRWEGGNNPVDSTVYDDSQSEDSQHQRGNVWLQSDIRQLKDGRRERLTFDSGMNKLATLDHLCTKTWSNMVSCGKAYYWFPSGMLSAIVQKQSERTIESDSWTSVGIIDEQTVKISADSFSERFYIGGKLYTDTIRPATTYHDDEEDFVFADPSKISATRYYDKEGNLVTKERHKELWGH